MAETLGEPQIAQLARESLEEEKAMAGWLDQNMDDTVRAFTQSQIAPMSVTTTQQVPEPTDRIGTPNDESGAVGRRSRRIRSRIRQNSTSSSASSSGSATASAVHSFINDQSRMRSQ